MTPAVFRRSPADCARQHGSFVTDAVRRGSPAGQRAHERAHRRHLPADMALRGRLDGSEADSDGDVRAAPAPARPALRSVHGKQNERAACRFQIFYSKVTSREQNQKVQSFSKRLENELYRSAPSLVRSLSLLAAPTLRLRARVRVRFRRVCRRSTRTRRRCAPACRRWQRSCRRTRGRKTGRSPPRALARSSRTVRRRAVPPAASHACWLVWPLTPICRARAGSRGLEEQPFAHASALRGGSMSQGAAVMIPAPASQSSQWMRSASHEDGAAARMMPTPTLDGAGSGTPWGAPGYSGAPIMPVRAQQLLWVQRCRACLRVCARSRCITKLAEACTSWAPACPLIGA